MYTVNKLSARNASAEVKVCVAELSSEQQVSKFQAVLYALITTAAFLISLTVS